MMCKCESTKHASSIMKWKCSIPNLKMISLCWQSTSSVTTNYEMADIIVSVCVGRHCVFSTQSNPSSFFEKVNFTFQCSDRAIFSSSSIISELSRTISFPFGLRIRSTSAITPSRLHLFFERVSPCHLPPVKFVYEQVLEAGV